MNAIQSILVENPKTPLVVMQPRYPCLLRYKHPSLKPSDSFIVMMHKPGHGTVVWSNYSDRKVGHYCDTFSHWETGVWELLPEEIEITLSNYNFTE